MHEKQRYVINIDLENFFPSISFTRVFGMFSTYPFDFNRDVSTVLSQICCFQGALPQGAPTSPIISNYICRSLDNKLTKLARKYQFKYTRYADDITFSTSYKEITPEIGIIDELNCFQLGEEFEKIIKDEGFVINQNKVRLQSFKERQMVTGLVVNKKANLRRDYIKNIRAMLHCWEKFGIIEAQKKFNAKYPNKKPELFKKTLNGRINFIKQVKGDRDPIYRKLHNKFHSIQHQYDKLLPLINEGSINNSLPIKNNTTVTISDLIMRGECDFIEFKEALYFNRYTKQKLDSNFENILKEMTAFLNKKDGGYILIGVEDSKNIFGIEQDMIITNSKNEDAFELHIRNKIGDKAAIKPLPLERLEFVFDNFCGKTVCCIKIKESEDNAIYHYKNDIYVRNGSSSIPLQGSNLAYWAQWKKKAKNLN